MFIRRHEGAKCVRHGSPSALVGGESRETLIVTAGIEVRPYKCAVICTS